MIRNDEYAVGLQPAEKVFLDRLRSWPTGWRMLDIGVGEGRTTPDFSLAAASYLAIDPDAKSIARAESAYSLLPSTPRFLPVGIESLRPETHGTFDFILFSFNGLDYAGPEARLQWLQAIHGLLSATGVFAFSSHNLFYASRPPSPRQWFHGKHPFLQAATHALYLATHPFPRRYEKADWTVLRDGGRAFSVRNYCIKPVAQMEQLESVGFAAPEIFDRMGHPRTQAELSATEETAPRDPWYYYWTRKAD